MGIDMQDTTDDDRQAILRLIEDESAAYWNRDYDAWALCWVQAPYIRKSGWWTQGGITHREGWQQISGLSDHAKLTVRYRDHGPSSK